MIIQSHKDYCLDKYKEEDVNVLINRKLLIHKQLERPSRTYVVYSDLHGSYEKYVAWVKNGLGYYRIVISEILGAAYSEEIERQYERLYLLINRTRIKSIEDCIAGKTESYDPKNYFAEAIPKSFICALNDLEKKGLSKLRILEDLMVVLRAITREDEHRIISKIPPLFLENILKLYFRQEEKSYESLTKGIVENEKIYFFMLSIIVKLTLTNMFDKHINLGDTFDRGNGADKLIKFYRTFFNTDSIAAPPLHYIWGNHDILWMGASIGNPILCVTALRISMRYNNVDFLFRYGFNLDKLKKFSLSCYKEMPSGKYIKSKDFDLWPEDVAAKMTKALLVLESKLTVALLKKSTTISGQIDYKDVLHHYTSILEMLPTNIPESKTKWEEYMKENPMFLDVFFPTIDPQAPEELTSGEQEVVDDLIKQFTTLPKLQEDINWMSSHGEVYRVVDNTLFYHAAIPSTEHMDLAEIKGMKGKDLLDFLQRDLKRIGQKKIDGEEITLREQMLFWYLWCGHDSPFFCKSKMATLERAVLDKELASHDPITTWKEEPNPYYANIRNDSFLNQILMEFHAQKICMGHTPVKSITQGILSDNLRAFIVDGGASDAYGDRGAVLINTPDYTYVTFHPSLQELKQAEKDDCLPDLLIKPIEANTNLKLRHMDKGYFLRRELEALDEILAEKLDDFSKDYFID